MTYSDKDTCCFCFPLHIAVIVIACTVIMECLLAIAESNAMSIIVTIILGLLFIISAIYRKQVWGRRLLAYGYVVVFILEVAIITKDILLFFKHDYAGIYCKALRNEGGLPYDTTVNECAL